MLKAHDLSPAWRPRCTRALPAARFQIARALAIAVVTCGCSDVVTTSDAEENRDGDVVENDSGVQGTPGRGSPDYALDDGSAPWLVMPDAGTGDAEKGGPPLLLSVQLACDMRADRFCSRLETCAAFTLRTLYGRYEACRARLAARCASETTLADSGHTTHSLVSCAQSLAAASCEEVLDEREPEPCRPTGRKRDGASCASHSQCESGFCSLAKQEKRPDGCGVCQPKQALGDFCSETAACTTDLLCVRGKCRKPGAACDDGLAVCEAHLACVQGRCSAPLAPGTACDNTLQCAPATGYICSADQARALVPALPVCHMSNVAAAGEVCLINGNIVAHCLGGPQNCAKDATGMFRCVKAARDGDPCGDPAQRTGCEAPARCIDGVCRLAPTMGCDL